MGRKISYIIKTSLILNAFFLVRNCSAQEMNSHYTSYHDSAYKKFNYLKAYKIKVIHMHKLPKESALRGFLYSIDSHHITICNINPHKINITNYKEVLYTKITDTSIALLKYKRHRSGIEGFGVSLGVAAIVGGIVTAKSNSGWFLNKEGKGILAGIVAFQCVAAALFYPNITPKKMHINGNPILFKKGIKKLHRRTRYAITI